MTTKKRKLTFHQERALHLLALAGRVKSVTSIDYGSQDNEVGSRTAAWLERNAYAQRFYTGPDAGYLVITREGKDAADELVTMSAEEIEELEEQQ